MEKRIVARKHITYEGLLRVDELYKIMDTWFMEHNYDKNEISNVQQTTAKGKQVQLFIEPYKKVSDYVKHKIQVVATFIDIQDTTAEVEGVKQNYQKGKVDIMLTAFLETDYEGTMEDKPFYFFTRFFYDKFIYKRHSKEAEANLLAEFNLLYNELKAYLNIGRFLK